MEVQTEDTHKLWICSTNEEPNTSKIYWWSITENNIPNAPSILESGPYKTSRNASRGFNRVKEAKMTLLPTRVEGGFKIELVNDNTGKTIACSPTVKLKDLDKMGLDVIDALNCFSILERSKCWVPGGHFSDGKRCV